MSELENCQKENEQLKNKFKAMQAQFNAAKQAMSEVIDANINLRTNLILVQQAFQEQVQKASNAEKMLVTLNKRISELEAPQTQPAQADAA